MTARARLHAEGGFTLLELLVAISLLGLIVVPLGMATVLGLRVTWRTDKKFTDSSSSLISSAYFSNDVASANSVYIPGSSGMPTCGSTGGTQLVSFSWTDPETATNSNIDSLPTQTAAYVTTTANGETKLLRFFCDGNGNESQSTVATRLNGAPTLTCYAAAAQLDPSCQSATWVKLAVTSVQNSLDVDGQALAQYSFTLEGTRRPT